MHIIQKIYQELFSLYGPQGWWPLLELHENGGTNPTKTGSIKGYHPNDYSYPRTDEQRFEICVGAILTQNTAWQNVEKALLNLKNNKQLTPKSMIRLKQEELGSLIKPAGYFNQKARKLELFSRFILEMDGRIPTREDLLEIWGIGPETADSILLYAYKVPTFVIDSYTRRIFANLSICKIDEDYKKLQAMIHASIQKDYIIFQEYHALIVEHAKRYYVKPTIVKEPLKTLIARE